MCSTRIIQAGFPAFFGSRVAEAQRQGAIHFANPRHHGAEENARLAQEAQQQAKTPVKRSRSTSSTSTKSGSVTAANKTTLRIDRLR